MLFVLILIALGFFPKQEKRYWMFATSAVAIQLAAQFLFSAGGTSENPAGDGIITSMLRQATNDDARVLWVFPFAMIFGWGCCTTGSRHSQPTSSQYPTPTVFNTAPKATVTTASVA